MRYLIAGAALLLAGILAAFLIAPRLVDETRLEALLVRAVKEWSGHDLTLDGGVDVRLLPHPVLTANGLRLEDGASGLRLAADRLDLDVALLPLLMGEVAIAEATLVRPFLSLGARPDPDPAGFAARLGGLLADPAVRRLRVVDGTAEADAGSPLLREIEGVFERDPQSGAGRLVASARLEAADPGSRLRLEAQIGAAAAGRPLPVSLSATLGDAPTDRLGLRGLWRRDRAAAGFEGRLSLESASPARLARMFGLDAGGDAVLLDALGVVALDSAITAGPGEGGLAATLDGMTLSLGGQPFTGRLDFLAGPEPVLDLRLSAEHLALPDEPAPFELSSLAGMLPAALAGRLDLDIAELLWRGVSLRRVGLELEAADGVIAIERATAELPGPGDLAFSGRLGPGGDDAEPALVGRLSVVLQAPGELAGRLIEPPALLSRSSMLALDADLDWRPFGITLANADLVLDTLSARGGIAWRAGGASGLPRAALRASIDRLALDELAGDRASWAALDQFLELAKAADLAIDLQADRASLAGRRLGAVVLRLESAAGQVTVERLSLADIAGSAVTLTGGIEAASRRFTLDMALDIASLPRLSRLWGIEPPAQLALLGPLNLRAGLRGDPARLGVEAQLDADLFTMLATAGLTDWREAADGEATIKLDAARATPLIRQLGGLPAEDAPSGPLAAELALAFDAGGVASAAFVLDMAPLGLDLLLARGEGDATLPHRLDLRLEPLTLPGLALLYRLATPPLGLVPGPPWAWIGDWPDRPLRLDGFAELAADLFVTLVPEDRAFSPVELRGRLQDGALLVPAFQWEHGESRVDGSLAIESHAAGGFVELALDLALERLPAETVLAAIGVGEEVLAGELDLEARLRTRGRGIRGLVGNLQGPIDLVISQGRLGGVSPEDVGITFERLEAPLSVARGVIQPADGAALRVAGPAAVASIDGYADLVAWLVELDLTLADEEGEPVARRRFLGPPGAIDELPPRQPMRETGEAGGE